MLAACCQLIAPLTQPDTQAQALSPSIYDEFKYYQALMQQLSQALAKTGRSDISIRALEYIFRNHAAEISLASAAEHLQVTKEYLSHVFKRDMKRTFVDFVQTFKMKEAALYLEFTDLRVYEIAASVGYQDAQYFSRLFRKFFAVAPEQFRGSLRGGS